MNSKNQKYFLLLIFYYLNLSGYLVLTKADPKIRHPSTIDKVIKVLTTVENKISFLTKKPSFNTTLVTTMSLASRTTAKFKRAKSPMPTSSKIPSQTNSKNSTTMLTTRLNKVHNAVRLIEDRISKFSKKDFFEYCKNCKGEYCRKRCRIYNKLLKDN